MDYRFNLEWSMENSLKAGNLEQALSHLHSLITSASSPSEIAHFLTNHSVNGLPTLHHLARCSFQDGDLPHLDKLIRILSDFGYNINKSTNEYCFWKVGPYAFGFTALLASISKQNLIMMECLLRHGARTDIRDEQGLSPCDWAFKVGNVKCLEKLVQFGGPSVLASTFGGDPLLHKEVEEGNVEIVSYLMSKAEEFGVDVNGMTVITDSLPKGPLERLEISPLGRAVRMENVPIIQVLLEHPRVKITGCKDLQFCMEWGLTEIGKFPRSSGETIKMLITHGLDVTGMVIGPQFTYTFGFNVILKMLYCAGAQIPENFLTSHQVRVYRPGHPESQAFLQEIAEVKQWKDDFDRNVKFSLKHMSRLQVRKTLKCVGDLKMLDGIPTALKDYVLCKNYF